MTEPEITPGAPTNGQRIYSHAQVLAKVPMCARTLLDMEKRGEFPRRFRVSPRRVGWDADEVEAWIADRKRGRAAENARAYMPCAPEEPKTSPAIT